jgi:hypothetical protein
MIITDCLAEEIMCSIRLNLRGSFCWGQKIPESVVACFIYNLRMYHQSAGIDLCMILFSRLIYDRMESIYRLLRSNLWRYFEVSTQLPSKKKSGLAVAFLCRPVKLLPFAAEPTFGRRLRMNGHTENPKFREKMGIPHDPISISRSLFLLSFR